MKLIQEFKEWFIQDWKKIRFENIDKISIIFVLLIIGSSIIHSFDKTNITIQNNNIENKINLILLLFSGIFLITAVLIINYFLKSDIESILMIIVGSSVLSKYGITYIPKTSLIVYFILLITNQFKIFMEWKKNG